MDSRFSSQSSHVLAHEKGFIPANVSVVRSQSDAPGSVTYSIGGTALPGRDYEALSGKLEFAADEAEATIIVRPLTNYRNTRKDETVVLTLNEPDGAVSEATVTITQDPSRKYLPSDEHFFLRPSIFPNLLSHTCKQRSPVGIALLPAPIWLRFSGAPA